MYVMIMDTETTNSIEQPLAYDIGWTILNLDNGEIAETRSLAIADVFCNKELMASAYFIDKVPKYWEDIKDGKRELKSLYNARKEMCESLAKYGITKIFCHNAPFDDRALKTTNRYITKSKYRWFLPYGVEIGCTLKMSREVFGKSQDYQDFCNTNGFLTKRGLPRFTAEIIYRFLKNDLEFVEEHEGLDDTLIEKEILLACLNGGIEI